MSEKAATGASGTGDVLSTRSASGTKDASGMRSVSAARGAAGTRRTSGTKATKGAASEEKRSHNQEIGRRGEDAAARYLARRGYEILERNWTCPFGEADIIALGECALVFVEVKTRTASNCGMPEEAVGPEKRRRYENIAMAYVRDHLTPDDIAIRFDVVGINVVAPDRAVIKHHINAWGVA